MKYTKMKIITQMMKEGSVSDEKEGSVSDENDEDIIIDL